MVLEVEGLKKSFGRRAALAGVDLVVELGETAILIGPTGAGKTTLLRVCAGVLEPDEGRARVFKLDVATDRRRAQERLGYVPAGAPIEETLSPWSYLRFLAGARGLDDAPARHAVRDAAGRVGLDREILKEGRRLAPLERRQVALAAALLGDPVLVMLDEPFEGLDDADAERFAARIAAIQEPERAVVIAVGGRAAADRVAGRRIEMHAGTIGAPQLSVAAPTVRSFSSAAEAAA